MTRLSPAALRPPGRLAALPLALCCALFACGDEAATSPDTSPPTDTVQPDSAPPSDTLDPGDSSATPDTLAPADTLTPADTLAPADTAAPAEVIVPVDPTRDPCTGVPLGGRCKGRDLELCIAGTGNAEPFVTTLACGPGTACADTGPGVECVVTGACTPGASECRGNRIAYCGDGAWEEIPCSAGCRMTVAGAACAPSAQTVRYSNTLTFEYRAPNPNFDDWSDEVYAAAARNVLILSFQNGELIDSTVTDDEGRFTLDATPPAREDGDDGLVAYLARLAPDGTVAYGLLDPGVTGEQDLVQAVERGLADGDYWMWSWTSTDIPAGDGTYLPLDAGSGAAFAYDYLSMVYDFADDFFGARPDTSVAFWLGMGTTWSCGACFIDMPANLGTDRFANQIFMPGDANEGYWSGAVLAHELGHWLMSTYGTSPGEGGKHIAGIPSHPGLAWSEGFATWFSSLVRGEPYYYDKQGGAFLWVDHSDRAYSSGTDWLRPYAPYGLEQLIDENEVTAMLLELTTDQNVGAMLAALASPRMTTAPFLRGYLRRTWDGLDAEGLPLPAWSTDDPAPHLADYLDALVCDGVASPAAIDAVTEPWDYYPYPSQAPLCRRPELPIQVHLHDTPTGTTAEVRWYIPLQADLTLSFAPPTTPPIVIPAGTPPGTELLTYTTAGPSTGPLAATPARPESLSVAYDDGRMRIHGAVPRVPKAVAPPARTGPAIMIHGQPTGPTIRLTRTPHALRAPVRPLR